MKLFFVIITLLLFSLPFYGQFLNPADITVDYSTSIISTTGLNLREAPKLDAKVIEKLPFGTKVTILSSSRPITDTIEKNIVYYENDEVELPIIGNWVKARYKNVEGYLFDSYLSNVTTLNKRGRDDLDENLNKDYVLLFPRGDCYNNFWNIENLSWLGCYKDGDNFKLEKIELSYYLDWVDPKDSQAMDIGRSFSVSTNDNKDLLFIIGSRNVIKKGEINGTFGSIWFENLSEFENLNLVDSEEGAKLVLSNSIKKQVLNSKEAPYIYPTFSVIWEGDLDFDGKLDYIIRYGDKNIRVYLYLSSEAEENNLVKPVSVYFSGYCC